MTSAEIILVIISAGSLLAAVCSAIAVWRANQITRDAFKWQQSLDAPDVRVRAAPDPDRKTILLIIIENVGGSIAYDVHFEIDRELPQNAYGIAGPDRSFEPMSDGPLVTGIPALAPRDPRRLSWGQYGGLVSHFGKGFAKVTARYRDDQGKVRSSLSVLDVVSWEHTDASDNTSLTQIVEQLRKIHGEVSGWSSTTKPLLIDSKQRVRKIEQRQDEQWLEKQRRQHSKGSTTR